MTRLPIRRLRLAAALALAPLGQTQAATYTVSGPLVNLTAEAAHDLHLIFGRDNAVLDVTRGDFDTRLLEIIDTDLTIVGLEMTAASGHAIAPGAAAAFSITVEAPEAARRIVAIWWTDAAHRRIDTLTAPQMAQLSFTLAGCDPLVAVCAGVIAASGGAIALGAVPLPATALLLLGALAPLAAWRRRG